MLDLRGIDEAAASFGHTRVLNVGRRHVFTVDVPLAPLAKLGTKGSAEKKESTHLSRWRVS